MHSIFYRNKACIWCSVNFKFYLYKSYNHGLTVNSKQQSYKSVWIFLNDSDYVIMYHLFMHAKQTYNFMLLFLMHKWKINMLDINISMSFFLGYCFTPKLEMFICITRTKIYKWKQQEYLESTPEQQSMQKCA